MDTRFVPITGNTMVCRCHARIGACLVNGLRGEIGANARRHVEVERNIESETVCRFVMDKRLSIIAWVTHIRTFLVTHINVL